MGGQARDQERLGRSRDDEVGRLARSPTGLTAEEFGLTLAEGKNLLSELGRLILQTQMEEVMALVQTAGSGPL